jgi:hypothetical protein
MPPNKKSYKDGIDEYPFNKENERVSKRPDFLFIGAMKCATTTLSVQLGAQPGIFMVSNPKELFFFSYDHNYAQGIDWYCSKFASAASDELCGEAATTYTQLPTYPHVVERMHKHLPQAKLLYVMRHPIDRLVSQYLHEFTLHKITMGINQAIHSHPELVDYSSYAMQLKPYLETFGPAQILPVFFERLHEYPQEELERICRFIGYAGQPLWNFEMDPRNVTKNRVMKNPLLTFLRKSPILKPVRQYLVPKELKKLMRRSLSNNLERPEINPTQTQYLKNTFDRDLTLLGRWLGTDLCCDNFREIVKARSLNWSNLSTHDLTPTATIHY